MFDRRFTFAVFFVVLATLALETRHTVEARYLPTRSNGEKVDKIRELLKELLENELEEYDPPPRWHPESKLFYKREAPAH
ncbi:uncharacterized protein BDFB_001493 [Asbolus verrucosus]|uniref:Uncharacterized protein n=1 Tax=Asbolus verrucosus TaxID=1661398 RepID=A0A482VWM8_ASBVE|nr:uncharacterized protein BDFB_001493 [Asbolus verrucosus]